MSALLNSAPKLDVRKTDQIAALPREFDRFEPKMAETRRAELYLGWQAAVARARYQPPLHPAV